VKALSLRQPWCDAVLWGGKRVENRLKWRGSNFRGEFFLHAAKGMTRAEYLEAIEFLKTNGIAWRPEMLRHNLVRGALVGRACVVDVVMPGGFIHPGPGHPLSAASTVRHPAASSPWYMGGFALVLEDVRPLPHPIPYPGMLGFFDVPEYL